MSFQPLFYPESRFGGFTDIDGTIAFYLRVNALLKPSFVVVDFGCARGAHRDDPIPVRRGLKVLRGKVERVIGLDIDPGAQHNPFIDEFCLLVNDAWPLPDQSADLCVCDSVLEHIENPDAFFAEAQRVLRRGGFLCIRTPNAWSYVSLAGRIVPNKLHARVLAAVQKDRDEPDVFPTRYRCNTIIRMRALLRKHGFTSVVYGYEAEPSYLSFSRVAYGLGVLHQRFAPGFLRPAIFAFAQLA